MKLIDFIEADDDNTIDFLPKEKGIYYAKLDRKFIASNPFSKKVEECIVEFVYIAPDYINNNPRFDTRPNTLHISIANNDPSGYCAALKVAFKGKDQAEDFINRFESFNTIEEYEALIKTEFNDGFCHF